MQAGWSAPAFVLGRFSGQFLALLDRFLDGADHIEGGFRQVIVLPVAEPFEALDGVLQVDQLAWRAGENLGDMEGLRQEALDFSRAGDCQLVLFRQFFHA